MAIEGGNIKYYPFTLDGVTRDTLCSGAAASSGGGSCLLLGERRKFSGVQGALSRAALVAPAGAKLPLQRVCSLGGRNGPGGYHDTPQGRSVFQECVYAANPCATTVCWRFCGVLFILGTRAMQFGFRHKKTRPAVARRADFCYNGRGGRCYQHLPRVNTMGSQLHLLTVGLLYPFCVVKSRLRPPKTGGFFYGKKQ